MSRRHSAQYRHTASLSQGEHAGAWEGDVTLIYSVNWGRRTTYHEPGEGVSITDWRIVAVDRTAVGATGPEPAIEALVEARFGEIEADLIEAAADADAYAEESYWDARREDALLERRA